ncbi:hypothetical protein [Kluyvera intermedia]|uniref:Ead/Ea22-like family protein n=1 Tax=Kluyvera intermedia TaxID=61648 RepID=A0AA95G5X9_KLUIN|nr:hypothetical protein [Kluyvera intermedia]WGL57868.1 hypothetical protein QBD33_08985 [Kluyvera intermedia]
MTATNQQMTSEQLADLSTLAVQLQAKAEANDDRDTAVMAYAVQKACAELIESRREFTAANATIHNLELNVAQVVAENGQMLRLLTDISENHDEYVNADEYLYAGVPMDYVSEINAYVSRDVDAENPFKATDAYLAEVRAKQHAETLNDLVRHIDKNIDIGSLKTPWELSSEIVDYVNQQLHSEFAAQLRQGAEK